MTIAEGDAVLHDPDDVLDYPFDWTAWLGAGETIIDFTITATGVVDEDASTNSAGIVTAWISGGTAGQRATVECQIVTSTPRTASRTRHLIIANR